MLRVPASIAVSVVLVLVGGSTPAVSEEHPPVVTVAQQGEADFLGADERPISEAIQKLGKSGGTVAIGPGVYTIRRELTLRSGLTIRGTDRTILRLPPPALVVERAASGQDFLVLSDTNDVRPDTTIQVCPPSGEKGADEEKNLLTVTIKRIDAGRIYLAQPLPRVVAEKSRVGYAHNLLSIRNVEKAIGLECLTLDGGRCETISMPGHVQRCAVLAHGNYSYRGGPGPALIEDLQVKACRIRNCYGRAVAMYAVSRGRVEGCLIERIADEAIDFDHFCLHCEATGNQVRDCVTGVTINDGSYCLVQHNHLERCGYGVHVWWWHMCPQQDIDVENIIAHNFIHSPKVAAISIGKRCFRNRVVGNFVEGPIKLGETDNTVKDNFALERQ